MDISTSSSFRLMSKISALYQQPSRVHCATHCSPAQSHGRHSIILAGTHKSPCRGKPSGKRTLTRTTQHNITGRSRNSQKCKTHDRENPAASRHGERTHKKPSVVCIVCAVGHHSRKKPSIVDVQYGGNTVLCLKTNTDVVTMTFDLLTPK